MNTTCEVLWSVAKEFVHDKSGIESPEDYTWTRTKGVYYPVNEGRICSCCGKHSIETYVVNENTPLPYEYYCSDECLHKVYTPEQYKAMIEPADDEEEEDFEETAYWTSFA